MRRIFLSFGVTLKKFRLIHNFKICGRTNEAQESMVGPGTLKMKPTIEENISISIKTSSLSPTIKVPTSGSSYMRKIASKDPTCLIRCVTKKRSYTKSSADCTPAYRLTWVDSTNIQILKAHGPISGPASRTINSISIKPSIKSGFWTILKG